MKHITGFFVRNRIYAFICIAIWSASLVLGAYSVCVRNGSDFEKVLGYTSAVLNYDMESGEMFRNSVVTHFKHSAAFLLCSSFIITFPVSVFLIGFKGYCAGFAAGSLVRAYGIRGSLISFCTLVIPYCVTVPLLFIMYVLGMKYQIMRIRYHMIYSRNQKKKEWLMYAAAMCICFLCLCLFSYVEAFFVPWLIKLTD